MEQEKNRSHAERERDVLAYWDEQKSFEKSLTMRPDGNAYVFYDGPPFATGLPHYGHIVGSVMKDVVPRYWTMKGFRVNRTWGWDCHGLPIENIVEKKFDLASRKDIEAFGIDTFNNACHVEVLTYAEEWKKVIRRLGRWVDMENAYKTMDMPFMESIWWVFKSLWEKGLIYEGHKPMHICPRCETGLSNFEVNQGYQDVTDISATAEFRLTSGKYAGADVLAWTTTPWTLPGNVLLAIGPHIEYVQVSTANGRFILAKERVEALFKGSEYTVDGTALVGDLAGSTYKPLFPFFADHKNAFRVVTAEFVTTTEGTGVVHIAPGFGEDDYELGKKEDVAPIMHVKMNGQFVQEVAKPLAQEGYDVDGVPVKSKEEHQKVDIEIIKYLAHHDTLFSKQKLIHSYPHCWRCDTPLLNYATSSWFVRVTDLKERMIATNHEINWVPENMKEGRFGKWLEGARDWAISRSRYWGTPLPIWKSEDGDLLCVGSVAELKALTGLEHIDNLHKHVLDGIEIKKDGKTYKRIPEVLDCWFESGSMPYAELHYPFENERRFERGFPAEFIAEGQDQTRGWFYTLHVLANALFDMPAFKNVIVNGIVLAEDGKKMAKRLQNYPDPMQIMERYGSDAVRMYLMSGPVVHAENLNFSEKGVDEVAKKFINILENVLSFYALYKEHDDGREPSAKHALDRWVISRLNETLAMETEAMDAYDLQTAARSLSAFTTDLSTWYVRRSRERIKALTDNAGTEETRLIAQEDAREALATLRTVLDTFAKMIAPFTPFLAEMVYQGVEGGFLGTEERSSVHHEDWPVAGEVDVELLTQMGDARALASRALEIREMSGRPVKQVLSFARFHVRGGMLHPDIVETLKQEINVREAEVEKGENGVELTVELTPELIRAGMSRDVSRQINALRKSAGLTINDRINWCMWSADEEVRIMLREHEEELLASTLATSVTFDKTDTVAHKATFRAAEHEIWIGF